jgi:hypothetical protein
VQVDFRYQRSGVRGQTSDVRIYSLNSYRTVRSIQERPHRLLGYDVFATKTRTRKEAKMTLKTKVAHRKLYLLELAKIMNNVSETCRLMRNR